MPPMLGGQVTAGANVAPVYYNDWGLFLNTIENGAALLNAAIKAATPPMVMFGHSAGAVCGNYWLANYASGSGIDPADLSFIFIGDSVNPYGGILGPNGYGFFKNWFGTSVYCPAATPFTVTDYIRQYDGWADWPTGALNTDAIQNAMAGQGIVHPAYQNVGLHDADLVSFTPPVGGSPGNITYVWSPTYPVPLLGTVWDIETILLDAALRPVIESAYSRPVTIPPAPSVPPLVLPFTLGG